MALIALLGASRGRLRGPASSRVVPRGHEELEVRVNLKACADCHAFFKGASALLGRRIVLREPRTVHTFENGQCSCGELWLTRSNGEASD